MNGYKFSNWFFFSWQLNCLDCGEIPDDPLRQPIQRSGKLSRHKADMTAGVGKFQIHRRRNFPVRRQRGCRQERIVARVDHQGWNLNLLEPRLTARSCPVVIGIFEAVNWRGVEIVDETEGRALANRRLATGNVFIPASLLVRIQVMPVPPPVGEFPAREQR